MIGKENGLAQRSFRVPLLMVLLPVLVYAYLTLDSHELFSAIHLAISTIVFICLGMKEINNILSYVALAHITARPIERA